jgi:hypothetical protein
MQVSEIDSQRPWAPLALLSSRLEANIAALAPREPALAAELRSHRPARNYFIQTVAENIVVAAQEGQAIRPLPPKFPPAKALLAADQVYPGHRYDQSLLIVGEDLGWLVNRIGQLPNDSYLTHRRPIFWVMPDLERFWIILHIQDWQKFLGDERLRLFVGNNALGRFQTSLIEDVSCCWPTTSLSIDANIWGEGESPASFLQSAAVDLQNKQARLLTRIGSIFAGRSAESFLGKLRSGGELRVLGICTRHSVFVQHSIADWLAAFERLGHRTQLLMEKADHQILHPTVVAEAIVEFEPDLVVMINHYRKEMSVVPDQVPFVMWAQDWCDNVACAEAGSAQGAMDFVLGHNPMRMRRTFGYPLSRFMPAIVAVNDERFQPWDFTPEKSGPFDCDVSFAGNASTPARTLLDAEIERIGSPELGAILNSIYGELESIYETGGSITQISAIISIIDRFLAVSGVQLSDEQRSALVDFFSHVINSALFRHQTLKWIADLGVDLRLYGRGWDRHPTLSRYARGIADNQTELNLVYQSSRINLHVSPHGVMHQRVMEGLASGGFFLLRRCAGDTVGRHFKIVRDWCRINHIERDGPLLETAPEAIQQEIREISRLLQRDLFAKPRVSFMEYLKYQATHGYLDCADLLWGEDYDAVCFDSARELAGKVQYFLANPDQRARRIESMRKPVLDRYTYLATTRRLLDFMAAEMNHQAQAKAAA